MSEVSEFIADLTIKSQEIWSIFVAEFQVALGSAEVWLSNTALGAKAAAWLAPYAAQLEIGETRLLIYALCTALIALIIIARLGKSRSRNSDPADLRAMTRSARRMGILTAVAFVGGFAFWSYTAPLSSATLAQGVVSPEGNRRALTHFEGGIVREIHVRDGEEVSQGQTLITLEDVAARARLAEMKERYHYLLANEARLIAEQHGKVVIQFPSDLTALTDKRTQDLISGQSALLEAKLSARQGREQILSQRLLQLDEQNRGVEKVIEAQSTQVALIEQEIQNVETLLKSGLAKVPRLLALKREHADTIANRAANEARLLENAQKAGETNFQLIAFREEYTETVEAELAEIRRNLAELKSLIPSREDVLERTVLKAPISGIIMEMNVNTVSGVVRGGEELLSIVPLEAPLVIDARVRPSDIDRVFPGMDAQVLLSAYKQRGLPMIFGQLQNVSADRFTDERTGEAYFLAKVVVDKSELENLDGVRMLPGMPADVMLLEDERTVVDYLLDPILSSLNRSFKES